MGKQSNANKATQLRQFRAEEMQKKLATKRRQTMIVCLISALAVVLCVAIVLLIVFNGNSEDSSTPTLGDSSSKDSQGRYDNGAPFMEDLDMSEINIDAFSETDEVTNYVKLNVSYTDKTGVQRKGDIVIRLYSNVAPKTVENFQNLVKSGFYNGSSFHRVVKDFMIQGGSGDGEAALTPIKGEFTNNGFYNNLEHLRGVVSMARTNQPDSATSQFFIMHADNIDLDFNYASFGYVVYGMDTVDGIANINVLPNYEMNGEISTPEHTVTINSAVFMTHEKN